MINISEFTQRLQKVIDYFEETASSFAEKIGVQRSSISHILSGRNKPSLDFVMKILNAYPEVELYWLLNGKGDFPRTEKNILSPELNFEEQKLDTLSVTKNKTANINPSGLDSDLEIDRIVIFYNDGSFKSYKH